MTHYSSQFPDDAARIPSGPFGNYEREILDLVGFIKDSVPGDSSSFGKYQIREILSQSPHANVVKAFDPDLERVVVLKVYLRDKDGLYLQDAFMEGRACARVQSPFVANCISIEEDEGHPFLVLEFVNGETITNAVGSQSFSEPRAVQLAAQIAEGIDQIHRQGYLHLDLKPCNVVLDYDERPRIIDFGLARSINQPIVSRFAGTPGFVAPELSKHLTEQVGRQTDVYGLGAILYFLLVGQAPFEGDTPNEQLLKASRGEFNSSKLVEAGVSRRLRRVIEKSLACHPSRRFSDASQFRAAVIPRKWNWSLTSLWGAVLMFVVGFVVGWLVATTVT